MLPHFLVFFGSFYEAPQQIRQDWTGKSSSGFFWIAHIRSVFFFVVVVVTMTSLPYPCKSVAPWESAAEQRGI